MINEKTDLHNEVANVISECNNIYNKLWICFTQSDQSTKFKLLAHTMIIRSKLMYGLESAALTEGVLKKIDTIRIKGLRKVLGIKNNSNR